MTDKAKKYLEKHLVATSMAGIFNQYDTLKSTIIGSFQDGITGSCFDDTYYHKGLTQLQLGTPLAQQICLPMFGLVLFSMNVPNEKPYILNDKHKDAQGYIDQLKIEHNAMMKKKNDAWIKQIPS